MKRKKPFLWLLLLAVLCIGGVELWACYHFAPSLFLQITRPVRQCIQAAAALGGQAADGISAWWEELVAEKEALTEADMQIAGDPAIHTDMPLSDPALTELKSAAGRDILTGGTVEVVYYNQSDEVWADQPYGTDDIGRYGCGPTAMAMVVASLTAHDIDPAQMAERAYEDGYWAKRSGSYLSIVKGLSAAYGLTAAPIKERTPEALQEALLSGNLVVALMGPGHFTSAGHFILLRGVTLSGALLVADPNSTERSLMEWAPQLILDELSASTSNGAPLWAISHSEP